MENSNSLTNYDQKKATASLVAAGQFDSDVAAVVVTYDGCADIWPQFFDLFFRFWPDRPYPLYLITNHLVFPDERVTSICVGDDMSWSDTLSRGLKRLSSRYVLLILEDFFLTHKVDTAFVECLRSAMVSQGAAYLRLVPQPPPEVRCAKMPELGVIAKGAPYRSSLQMAFWDRNVLLGLLRAGESAWDFELKGSRRSDAVVQPFLSVCGGVTGIPYRHVLFRGKLLPQAVRQFTSMGVEFDVSKRAIKSELMLRWEASALRRFLGRAWRLVTRRPL